MNIWYLLMIPGEFLARRFDKEYAGFSDKATLEIQRGNHKLLLSAGVLPICEFFFILSFGLFMGIFGLVWPLLVVAVLIYPLAALIDPWVWRKIYRTGKNNRKTSFLINLNSLYWFMLGWMIGCLVL